MTLQYPMLHLMALSLKTCMMYCGVVGWGTERLITKKIKENNKVVYSIITFFARKIMYLIVGRGP